MWGSPKGTETEFLVQGTISASFVQWSLTPVFRSFNNYLLCLKNQALQADLPWWTWRQIHPFIGKKAIYLVIVNYNYLFLDGINLQIFFSLLTLVGLLFHCGFIYSIIARPISVGFCTLLILMRCMAHRLYFLLKRVSMKWNI